MNSDPMTKPWTHAPEHPFGCVVNWGPPLPPGLPDGGLHICNHDSGHKGKHVCRCGAEKGSRAHG